MRLRQTDPEVADPGVPAALQQARLGESARAHGEVDNRLDQLARQDGQVELNRERPEVHRLLVSVLSDHL